MHIKLLGTMFFCISASGMQIDSGYNHTNDTPFNKLEEKIEKLIGQPIPWVIYVKALFSKDHTFEVGELVAIPSSNEWGTKNDPQAKYAKIKTIGHQEITVLFTHNPGSELQDIKTIRFQSLGKLSRESIHEALNYKQKK